jgi:preprotein translocase subunit SecD
MKIEKNIRLVLLVVLVLVAVYSLVSPMISRKNGVVVSLVEPETGCSNIKEGDVITQVEGFQIKDSTDFKNAVSTVKSGNYVTLVVNGGPGNCKAVKDGGIGVVVDDIETGELVFGLGIGGGTKYIFEPSRKLNADDIKIVDEILKKRIKSLKISEGVVGVSENSVEITGAPKDKIGILVGGGEFEATILEGFNYKNNTGEIKIGNDSYKFEVNGSKLILNNNAYDVRQNFTLDGVRFDLKNVTNESVVLEAFVFGNDDITTVHSQLSYVKFRADGSVYEFVVPVDVSKNASDRFAKITKRLGVRFTGTQSSLEGLLAFTLDGNLVNVLNIPSEMAGTEIKTISVIGFEKNAKTAQNIKSKISVALESGKLPVELKMVGSEPFKGSLSYLLDVAPLVFIVIGAAAFVLNYLRHKKLKFGFIKMIFIFSLLIVVLGLIGIIQKSSETVLWLVDLPTMVGLIFLGIFALVDVFVLTESVLKNRDMKIKYKQNNIMSVQLVFRLVVLITAFVSLFSVFRGFGLTIILGVFIEVLLINPLYKNFLV